MALAGTKTDVERSEWAIDDAVVRLRVWGTDWSFVLPSEGEPIVGSAETCGIRLHDPTERVSRQHARVVRQSGGWAICDLDSKNGIYVDGAKRDNAVLTAGVEVGVGGLTVIAESTRLIALRSFLARLLGWSGDRIETVDLALRAVRLAATRRARLVISGDGDLMPIAYGIHELALGSEKPFVACDPRRRRSEATARSVATIDVGMTALEAAAGGTLCIWSQRVPRDFAEVTAALRDPAVESSSSCVRTTPPTASASPPRPWTSRRSRVAPSRSGA
jgi:hypothetical protein